MAWDHLLDVKVQRSINKARKSFLFSEPIPPSSVSMSQRKQHVVWLMEPEIKTTVVVIQLAWLDFGAKGEIPTTSTVVLANRGTLFSFGA